MEDALNYNLWRELCVRWFWRYRKIIARSPYIPNTSQLFRRVFTVRLRLSSIFISPVYLFQSKTWTERRTFTSKKLHEFDKQSCKAIHIDIRNDAKLKRRFCYGHDGRTAFCSIIMLPYHFIMSFSYKQRYADTLPSSQVMLYHSIIFDSIIQKRSVS